MHSQLSKSEAEQKIKEFFEKSEFTPEELKKIKRLAMKFKIKLKEKRKKFCKKCFSQLRGKIRISKTHKTIECEKCGFKNKFKVS